MGRVMHEDVAEIGHFVRLLRRITTLVAVILAVPLVLSTITSVVRIPPEVATLHNLLGAAFNNASGRTILTERTPQKSAPANLADPQEAGAVETEKVAARSASDTSSALAAMSNSAMPMVADAAHDIPLLLAANDDAAGDRTDPKAAMGPPGASDAEALAMSASAPITGPIRLPRPRPHNAGTIRTADTTLSHVPMPRPRPVADAVGRSD